MTPEQFLTAADRTRLTEKSRAMAYQVLVLGVPGVRVAEAYSVHQTRVVKVVARVVAALPRERCPRGWKRVVVRVPERDVGKVLAIEARARARG